MSLLPLHLLGSPVLRQHSAEVKTVDDEVRRLVGDLFETMDAARGIGLAANQVGVNKRLAVIDLSVGKRPGELHVLINPEIAEVTGRLTDDEGCLSVPDFTETVGRPERVRLRFLDRNGEPRDMWGEGLMARAMSHEIDHLDGKLFVDHLRGFKRDRIVKKIQKLAKAGMW